MSNPFRKTSALKRLLSILVLVAFSFTFSPVAMAQGDFDFSDDAGGDFDFSDDTFEATRLRKEIRHAQ